MSEPVVLYHYCCEHSRREIGRYGTLIPKPQLWGGSLVWLTDMAEPDAEGLGLTSHIQPCDRLEYRYVVRLECTRWMRSHSRALFKATQGGIALAWFEHGRMPERWWVSDTAVPARIDRLYHRPSRVAKVRREASL